MGLRESSVFNRPNYEFVGEQTDSLRVRNNSNQNSYLTEHLSKCVGNMSIEEFDRIQSLFGVLIRSGQTNFPHFELAEILVASRLLQRTLQQFENLHIVDLTSKSFAAGIYFALSGASVSRVHLGAHEGDAQASKVIADHLSIRSISLTDWISSQPLATEVILLSSDILNLSPQLLSQIAAVARGYLVESNPSAPQGGIVLLCKGMGPSFCDWSLVLRCLIEEGFRGIYVTETVTMLAHNSQMLAVSHILKSLRTRPIRGEGEHYRIPPIHLTKLLELLNFRAKL